MDYICPKCLDECMAVPESDSDDAPMVSDCCGEVIDEASYEEWDSNQRCLDADARNDEQWLKDHE